MRGRSDWIACARTRRGLAAVLLGQRATPVRQVANNTKMSEKKGGSNKPRCSKQKEQQVHRHLSRATVNKRRFASTTSSEPRVDACPKCYTINEVHSELINSETSQTTKTKVNCRFHHAATQCKGSEQTKFEQVKHHLRPPKTRPVLLIGYLKDL